MLPPPEHGTSEGAQVQPPPSQPANKYIPEELLIATVGVLARAVTS